MSFRSCVSVNVDCRLLLLLSMTLPLAAAGADDGAEKQQVCVVGGDDGEAGGRHRDSTNVRLTLIE